MRTGMIGLGAMGIGMARNLAKAGFLTGVYNRTADKAARLAAELNVAHCRTPQQLAGDNQVVLTCVSADADVLEMIDAICETAAPGTIVVDMSTVSLATAQRAQALLAERRCSFLDAPVSGGVEGARQGTLAMMVGGDATALQQVRAVLASMATRIMHMGECGNGQATKAVNQIMCAGINQAVCEALAFGQRQGLDMDKVIEVVSGGAAGNWFLEHRGPTMVHDRFQPGFKLALHHKDLNICRQMADANQVPIALTEKTLAEYEKLMAQGYGDEDISALYRLFRDAQ